MRIRVAHVNQQDLSAQIAFKMASARKLAWITGTTEPNAELVDAADRHGYLAVFSPDQPVWLAVRADLIKQDTWVPNIVNGLIFAAFETNVNGLGELIVASGVDVDPEELGTTLGFELVFSGGKQDGELGFGFYDEAGRVQRLTTAEGSNDNYLEALIIL